MFGVVTALDPMHIEVAGFEIHLLPPERHEFGRAQAVAKHQENNGGISYPMAAGFPRWPAPLPPPRQVEDNRTRRGPVSFSWEGQCKSCRIVARYFWRFVAP